jgi:hypothetical protein
MAGPIKAQLPPENIEVSASGPWRRFFESMWRRSGGFGDAVYDAAVLAQVGDATLAEVSAQGEQLARLVEQLRGSQEQSRVLELEEELRQLRGVVDGLKGSVDAAMGDNIASLIAERFASLQISGATTLADEVRQDLADIRALLDGVQQSIAAIRGDTYATDEISESLGTASVYDIGTTGNAVPVLDAANFWDLEQTFYTAPNSLGYKVLGVSVVGARQTGWSACTGTALKGGFATYTAPTISAAYVQAEVQAIADALQSVSRTVKALVDKDITAGNIGA